MPIATAFTMLVFVVPILFLEFGGETAKNFCGLSSANAQDNPCLVQDATISALEGALLQATIDTIDHQATVVALQSAPQVVPPQGDSGSAVAPQNVPGLPFVDNFDDNSSGWALTDGNYMNGDQLIIANNFDLYVPISIPDNFYVELNFFHQDYPRVTIKWGQVAEGTYNQCYFDVRSNYCTSLAAAGSTQLITNVNSLVRARENQTVSIEHQNGDTRLYVNGEMLGFFQSQFEGDQLVITGNGLMLNEIQVRQQR